MELNLGEELKQTTDFKAHFPNEQTDYQAYLSMPLSSNSP